MMSGPYAAVTRHVHPNGDETWTNMYDGSTQQFKKADLEKNNARSDEEIEKDIEAKFKDKKR